MLDVKLVSTRSGDWEGLYIDGRLVHEGHEVRLRDFFDCVKGSLPVTFGQRETSDVEEEHARNSGRLPAALAKAKGATPCAL
jgi:hypothetical protein